MLATDPIITHLHYAHIAVSSCSGLKKEMQTNGLNPLSANPTKWSNTLKQFVGFL